MRIVYFTHSLRSCWNHGNAHFLRGTLRELIALGHRVTALEPASSWSHDNLLADGGTTQAFAAAYPDLTPQTYGPDLDLDAALDAADLVIVHEWNPPDLVARIGAHRRSTRRHLTLFHDTHHRAVSDPQAIRAFDLAGYDGVLAFGAALTNVYRKWGWGERVFTWHEAADTRLFKPPATEPDRQGLIWIGNWGDEERTHELETFLLAPAQAAGLPLDLHGVRYPPHALQTLARYGARYHGWLANAAVPAAFARHLATVHVPRRFYVTQLPGIPTIRVFEALACGIALATAPWDDAEGLFAPDPPYLIARSTPEMTAHLRALAHDADLRADLAARGLAAIRARHTCAHRAAELLDIAATLRQAQPMQPSAQPVPHEAAA